MGKFRKPKPEWTLTIIDNGEGFNEAFRFSGTISRKGWFDIQIYARTREDLERKAARHKNAQMARESAIDNAVTVTL